ncbi:GntR family transcriptional regulator [Streptomyces californicus]|uniref:GntR family transcriptional regulator n=1 Tax=Streptomyces californicus TaxID=67351 RepID=UPI00381DB3CC
MTAKKRDAGGYDTIAEDLRSRIENGDLPPGAKVPGEKELMALYGVSRDTAYQALKRLRAEGLTVGRQGAPTRVRTYERIRRPANKRLSAEVWGEGRSMWSADLAGGKPDVLGLKVERVAVDESTAGRLGIPVGGEAVRRSRYYVVDEKPVLLSTAHIPADLAQGTKIEEENTGPGGVWARLADQGHAPVRSVEEVICRMPWTSEKSQLQMLPGTPVVEITRSALDEGGRVVELNVMVLDASNYVLEYVVPA